MSDVSRRNLAGEAAAATTPGAGGASEAPTTPGAGSGGASGTPTTPGAGEAAAATPGGGAGAADGAPAPDSFRPCGHQGPQVPRKKADPSWQQNATTILLHPMLEVYQGEMHYVRAL